jgi:ElaB/YqjD/DUF883 family membrane-anchored ribosome-binding protein
METPSGTSVEKPQPSIVILQKAESWVSRYPWIAIAIAGFIFIVIGAIVGDYRQGKKSQEYLDGMKAWSDAYKRDIAATESKFNDELKAKDKRVRAANAKYDALKKKVDEAKTASQKPWTYPLTEKEMIERFQLQGYPGVLK